MPNKEQSLLSNRENYIVPKGQEHTVHYKIAKLTPSGEFLEKPRIVATGEKLFDSCVMRNLELQGYTIEILYHPSGKYTSTRIVDKNVLIDAQNKEIERLKAELEEYKAASTKKEVEVEDGGDSSENKKKKVGRPNKEV